MTKLFRLLPIAAILFLPAIQAEAARSIVGKWADSKSDCSKGDIVKIGPRSIDSGYVICHFNSVKRKGSTVTWGGACHVDSARRPETGDGTVVAVEKNGKLSIDGLGFGMGPLVRC